MIGVSVRADWDTDLVHRRPCENAGRPLSKAEGEDSGEVSAAGASVSDFWLLNYKRMGFLLRAILNGMGVWGEWTQGYVRLCPSAVHLKVPQHCSSAVLQYKVFWC